MTYLMIQTFPKKQANIPKNFPKSSVAASNSSAGQTNVADLLKTAVSVESSADDRPAKRERKDTKAVGKKIKIF